MKASRVNEFGFCESTDVEIEVTCLWFKQQGTKKDLDRVKAGLHGTGEDIDKHSS